MSKFISAKIAKDILKKGIKEVIIEVEFAVDSGFTITTIEGEEVIVRPGINKYEEPVIIFELKNKRG